jgi:hypothetical protein
MFVIPSGARNLHVILLLAATQISAQSIATRVGQAPDGVVRMEFEAREGVCGNGRDVIAYGNIYLAHNMQSFGGRWNDARCKPGNIRVSLYTTNHKPTRLVTQVGGAWRGEADRVTDLGVVESREASQYIFSLVPALETSGGKDRLLVPAVLAANADVIRPLTTLARDDDRALNTRRSAIMWLGVLGDASVVPTLLEFARQDVNDEGDEKAGKKGLAGSAMAALSALDDGAGIPALIDLARNGPGTGTRRNAVFWLGQNGDPRGLRVLHEVIENDRESARLREHAIFALSQVHDDADSESAYILARARDTGEPVSLRRAAIFWAGQRASTDTKDIVAFYRDADREELREHTIFVLSQRQDDEATDALLEIAREDRESKMRGKALFWLAQRHDPRVQKLIADMILK